MLITAVNTVKGTQQRRKWNDTFGVKLNALLMMNELNRNVSYHFAELLILHGKGIKKYIQPVLTIIPRNWHLGSMGCLASKGSNSQVDKSE